MNDFVTWLRGVSPGMALKWGGVIFAYCVAILILISIILSMFGAYG